MLRLDLEDGTVLGLTDHDRDIELDIGDGAGTAIYRADLGVSFSNIDIPGGLDTGNFEFEGPISSIITREAVLGGRFNYATVYPFEVNWKAPDTGRREFPKGNLTEINIEGGKFKAQVRDLRDKFNQVIGNVITNLCKAEHAACCVNIGAETATTVTAVASALEFTVAATLTDNHVPGRVWFTSGDLVGTRSVEIYSRSGNTITLFAPLVELPQIGDALVVKEGCDRTRTMCRDRFDNVLEFRGYPEVPGSDQVLRMPIPGQGNDEG
jgi:uncharacterized phage protein (TIGR02218 family)